MANRWGKTSSSSSSWSIVVKSDLVTLRGYIISAHETKTIVLGLETCLTHKVNYVIYFLREYSRINIVTQ